MLNPNILCFVLQVFTDGLFYNLHWTFWKIYTRWYNFGLPQCLPFQKVRNLFICGLLVSDSFSYFLSRNFKHSSQVLQLLGTFRLKIILAKKNKSKRKALSFCLISLATNFIPQALDLLHSCSFYSKHSFLSFFIVFIMFCHFFFCKGTLFAQFYSSTILLFSPYCLIFIPFEVKPRWKAFPVAKMIFMVQSLVTI